MSKLTDYLKTKNSKLEIMEGKEKEDLKSILDKIVHINNFDFLTGDDGDYAVFTIAEDEKSFYFGSSIITDMLKDLEKEGLKQDVINEGVAVKLVEKKSKTSKRTYIAVEIIDETEELPF